MAPARGIGNPRDASCLVRVANPQPGCNILPRMPPPPTPSRRALLAGGATLALAAAAALAWQMWVSPIPKDDVAAFLDQGVGAGKVRFSDMGLGVERLAGGELKVSVTATARAPWPLYAAADAAAYMKDALGIDPGPTAEARSLCAAREGSLDPGLERLRPFPADPYRATVLRAVTPAGAAFPYQAVLAAHKAAGGWAFTQVSGAYGSGGPRGEPRASFGSDAFLASDAGDDARLRALATGLQAFALRVADAQRDLAAAHAAQADARRGAFLARIAPGTVFRGTALRAGDTQPTVLYLEITDPLPGGRVAALLRNAGGWHDARAFQGSFSADADFAAPVLHLSSAPDQAVRDAGPYLENTQAWSLDLGMDPSGALTEANRSYQYAFQPLDAAQASNARAALGAEYARAAEAARPGALYRGAATPKDGGAPEPLLLRFTAPPGGGEAVAAQLESTTRSWSRAFSGRIMGNARRSGGAPLRLRSPAGAAADGAGAGSALGAREDLELVLGVEDGALAGEDALYAYRFAPEGAGDLDALNAARAALAARLRGALRGGIAFDGTVRDDQGSVSPVRLEVERVDPQRGAVAARIVSLAVPDVYQDFTGAWDPSDPSVTLASTGLGSFDSTDSVAVPFLVAPVPATLQLALAGTSLTGAIRGNPHWVLDFPLAVFLASGAGAAGPGAEGPLPVLPQAAGAYLLSGGDWTPLPHNNGRVVEETSHAMTGEEEGLGVVGALSSGIRRIANKGEKATYLDFDGKDPLPEAAGPAVTLLYVGPAAPHGPAAEVAAAGKLKDGRRRIEVEGKPGAPVRFGEQRAAAYLRPAGPGAFLLTLTAALPAGTYAVNAGPGFEFLVK